MELAKMYKAVELLCTEERRQAMSKLPIHPLTIGKLLEIAKLVERVEGSELYACFDPARLEDPKALFVRACGDGIDNPPRADIAARVPALKDPEKFAAKKEEQGKAEEAKAKAAAEGAEADSLKSRRCLSTTVTNPRPAVRFSRPPASARPETKRSC